MQSEMDTPIWGAYMTDIIKDFKELTILGNVLYISQWYTTEMLGFVINKFILKMSI